MEELERNPKSFEARKEVGDGKQNRLYQRQEKKEACLAPIIFTPEMVVAIEEIRKHLDNDEDDTQNIFSGIKGWDAMQRVAAEISDLSEEQKRLLTPSRTRIFLATMLQVLHLSKKDLEDICTHMAHSQDVHRKSYRQENSTTELTKIATVLTALSNSIDIKNKSINELLSIATHCVWT